MSEQAGQLHERREGSLLSRIGTYLGGGLATAKTVEIGYNEHLAARTEGELAVRGFEISPPITTSRELTEWLEQNPSQQYGDPLFLDTPLGVEPNLT